VRDIKVLHATYRNYFVRHIRNLLINREFRFLLLSNKNRELLAPQRHIISYAHTHTHTHTHTAPTKLYSKRYIKYIIINNEKSLKLYSSLR